MSSSCAATGLHSGGRVLRRRWPARRRDLGECVLRRSRPARRWDLDALVLRSLRPARRWDREEHPPHCFLSCVHSPRQVYTENRDPTPPKGRTGGARPTPEPTPTGEGGPPQKGEQEGRRPGTQGGGRTTPGHPTPANRVARPHGIRRSFPRLGKERQRPPTSGGDQQSTSPSLSPPPVLIFEIFTSALPLIPRLTWWRHVARQDYRPKWLR